MNVSLLDNKRQVWVDWMKILGMYFIIIGHMFPTGYKYIYVFSVPVFFFISGYLTHKEENNSLFWKKIWYNLIIPLFCFSLFNFLWMQMPSILHGNTSWDKCFQLPVNIFIGNQGENFKGVGLISMWFVYTLCILKITIQYVPSIIETVFFTVILLLSVAGNIELSNAKVDLYNSWSNVLIAIPFFYLGYCLRKHILVLNRFKVGILPVLFFFVSIGLIAFCGKYNDVVFMYNLSYGRSYLLFLLGSFAGIYAIFFAAKCLQGIDGRAVWLLGGGTIVILGLQSVIIRGFAIMGVLHLYPVLDYILGLLILIMFIPINWIVKEYMPFLYGSLRK